MSPPPPPPPAGDGRVSWDEFLWVVARLVEGLDSEEELLDVFRELDTDNNEQISKADLREMVVK